MFGKTHIGLAAISLLSASPIPLLANQPVIVIGEYPSITRERKHVRRGLSGTAACRYRSRGASAKRAKKPNRLTISRRTRRKHRRAA